MKKKQDYHLPERQYIHNRMVNDLRHEKKQDYHLPERQHKKKIK